MKVTFCDRCGKEIGENDPHCSVIMQSSPEMIGEMFLGGAESRWDLCGACSREAQNFMSGRKAKTTA